MAEPCDQRTKIRGQRFWNRARTPVFLHSHARLSEDNTGNLTPICPTLINGMGPKHNAQLVAGLFAEALCDIAITPPLLPMPAVRLSSGGRRERPPFVTGGLRSSRPPFRHP